MEWDANSVLKGRCGYQGAHIWWRTFSLQRHMTDPFWCSRSPGVSGQQWYAASSQKPKLLSEWQDVAVINLEWLQCWKPDPGLLGGAEQQKNTLPQSLTALLNRWNNTGERSGLLTGHYRLAGVHVSCQQQAFSVPHCIALGEQQIKK